MGRAILPAAAFLGGSFEAWRVFHPGREEPAKSRLQPELAAPRFVPNVAKVKTMWHWAVKPAVSRFRTLQEPLRKPL